MKDILTGMFFLFTVSSCAQFWLWFIKLEKTNQIRLGDKNE